jgi:hypothetical protein
MGPLVDLFKALLYPPECGDDCPCLVVAIMLLGAASGFGYLAFHLVRGLL